MRTSYLFAVAFIAIGGCGDGSDGTTTPDGVDDADGVSPDADDSVSPDAPDAEVDSGPDPGAPGITLIEPAGGAVVGGTVTLAARATSADGAAVEGVRFRWTDLGMLACEDGETRPSGEVFSCEADLGDISTGAHTLVADATLDGELTLSDEVQITVVDGAPSGTTLVTGVLTPPDGASASDYTVGNTSGTTPVGGLGFFSLGVRDVGITVTMAARDDAGEEDVNALLALTIHVPGDLESRAPDPLVIDARSTAAALVYLHPDLMSRDPLLARAVVAAAAPAVAPPELEVLVTEIQRRWANTPQPFDDEGFAALYGDAVAAVAARVRSGLPPPAGTIGGPVGNLPDIGWHRLDQRGQIQASITGDTVTVSVLPGFPVDATLLFGEVDVDALHGLSWLPGSEPEPLRTTTMADSLRNIIYRPGEGESFFPDLTLLPGTTRHGAVASLSAGSVVDLPSLAIDGFFDLLLTEPPQTVLNEFTIRTDEPGLYVVRAFTGMLTSGFEWGELPFVTAPGRWKQEYTRALMLNVVVAAAEFASAFVDVSTYARECAREVLAVATISADEIDFTPTPSGEANAGALSIVRAASGDAKSEMWWCVLGKLGHGPFLQRFGRIVRVTAKTLNPIGKGVAIYTIGDRLANIKGVAVPNAAGLTVSPMDTILIRVGDPFSPVVETVTHAADGSEVTRAVAAAVADPLVVRLGDTIRMTGVRFKPDRELGPPDRLWVRFTDQSERAKDVQATIVTGGAAETHELSVVVPDGLVGVVNLKLLRPGFGFVVGEVLVIEPQLRCSTSTTAVPAYGDCADGEYAVSPDTVFKVLMGGGEPANALGGNYVADIAIGGRGLDPRGYHVRLWDGDGLVGTPLPPIAAKTKPTELRVGTDESTLVGEYTLAIETGITTPSFAARFPDGVFVTGVQVRILGPPVFTEITPEAVANRELFFVRGFNFGQELGAVSLELPFPDGGFEPVALPVLSVGDFEAGVSGAPPNTQPAVLAVHLDHLVRVPWAEGTEALQAILKTPAGQTDVTIPLGDEILPTHRRAIKLQDPGDLAAWDDALAMVQGRSFPSVPGGAFQYEGVDVDGDFVCQVRPDLGDWEHDPDDFGTPGHPLGISRPPGVRGGGGSCFDTCTYDDPLSFDHTFHTIWQLPDRPCPETWEGVGPTEVHDGLYNEHDGFHLSPPEAPIEVTWLDLHIDVGSGGGLHLLGVGGRSHLSGDVTIGAPSVPTPQTPILTLEDIDGADLTLDLTDADPASCGIAVRIKNSKNVMLRQPQIGGCATGIEIEGSQGVRIFGGEVRDYGDQGVGIRISNSTGVIVDGTEIRPYGGGIGVSASARGVVVDNASSGVRIRPAALRRNAVGIEIFEASQIEILGRIGVPVTGEPGTNEGNGVGIDIVGPADQITIGGNPFVVDYQGQNPDLVPEPPPAATVIANNGRTIDGVAGVRIQDATRVTIKRAYIGLVAPHSEEGNRVGVQIVGQPGAGRPNRVAIERCHIGQNTEAGVEVIGETGSVDITSTVFAGPKTAWWGSDTPPHPDGDPEHTAGACTLEAVGPGGDFDPAAPLAFTASDMDAPAVLVRDGAGGVTLEDCHFIGDGLVVQDSDEVTVVHGTFTASAAEGVRLTNSSAVSLEEVALWANQGSGVVLDGSTGVDFSGCSVANGQAGLEATGDAAGGGGNVIGRARKPESSTSVIVAPPDTKWAHQEPKLVAGATEALFVANGTHGVHVHDGTIPLVLSQAAVFGNDRHGVLIDTHQGTVEIVESALGIQPLAGGDVAVANTLDGLHLEASAGAVTVGRPGFGNVISGNSGWGVRAHGSGPLLLEANFIGTDRAGLAAIPNDLGGIFARQADGLVIGQLGKQSVNVVSGNAGPGIEIDAKDVIVPGEVTNNYVGLGATAATVVANQARGVEVSACNLVTSAPTIKNNLISGNGGSGLALVDCDGKVRVRDNVIGLRDPNFSPASNGADGVAVVRSRGAEIDDNRIYSESGAGVAIETSTVSMFVNRIEGSGAEGVRIFAGSVSNLLQFNTITASGGDGVAVTGGSVFNDLVANSITANQGDAIALSAGGNFEVSAPTITASEIAPGEWALYGTADALNGSEVDIFADEEDEARIPLKVAVVRDGRWAIRGVTNPAPAWLMPASDLSELNFCATVTGPFGNTSEVGCSGPVSPTCDLGPAPPDEAPPFLAGLEVVTAGAGAYQATRVGNGDRGPLSDLSPAGPSAAVCGHLVAFSGGDAGQTELYLRDLVAGQTTQLTTSAGDDLEPAFDAGCATIAFASDRTGSWDIYTIGVDGAGLAAITEDPDEDRNPTFGSAAGEVIFARRPAGAGDFDIFVASGGAPIPLVQSPGDDLDPALHPDGDRLAFVRCLDDWCQLATYAMDDGRESGLGPAACVDRHPEWLVVEDADGDELASYLLVARSPPGMDAAPSVVLVSDQGHVQWRLTPADTHEDHPACCLDAP